MTCRIIQGNNVDIIRKLQSKMFDAIITSPPYWGLRDYGDPRQLGLEPTPERFIQKLVLMFRECKRILKDDGLMWVNLGDSYWDGSDHQYLKLKDLIGLPWMLAFALQRDGWYLRSDVIWCLSGGVWVYAKTKKGEMPIMIKDLVRLNPASVKLWNGKKWTKVLGWGKSGREGKRIELVLRSGERVGCTDNHEWPTQRGNVSAKDIRIGDIISTCQLPDVSLPMPSYLTNDALWLFGLYLAEGSRADDTIQISLHKDEIRWLDRITMAANHLGATVAHTISGNSLHVRIYGRVMVAAIEQYIGGDNAHNKHLNVCSWMLPNSALRHIACGYLDGDGHEDGSRVRLGFCRNYSLERDLRTLAARLNATITLKKSLSSYQNGVKKSFRGEWRWGRNGHFNEKDRGEVVKIGHSRARFFWDIAVEDDPHLFALASGVLTHNCKPNPMPESVRDRPTKSHEHIFMFSKSETYKYNAKAIQEPVKEESKKRQLSGWDGDKVRGYVGGRNNNMDRYFGVAPEDVLQFRNKRDVWTVTVSSWRGAHFATYPKKLIEPCVLASSDKDGWIFDPFAGSGTTGIVAHEHGRNFIGAELNPEFVEVAKKRFAEENIPLETIKQREI